MRPRNYLEAALMERRLAKEPKPLVERHIRDQTGRIITEFDGSPMAWMAAFTQPSRRVARVKTR